MRRGTHVNMARRAIGPGPERSQLHPALDLHRYGTRRDDRLRIACSAPPAPDAPDLENMLAAAISARNLRGHRVGVLERAVDDGVGPRWRLDARLHELQIREEDGCRSQNRIMTRRLL